MLEMLGKGHIKITPSENSSTSSLVPSTWFISTDIAQLQVKSPTSPSSIDGAQLRPRLPSVQGPSRPIPPSPSSSSLPKTTSSTTQSTARITSHTTPRGVTAVPPQLRRASS